MNERGETRQKVDKQTVLLTTLLDDRDLRAAIARPNPDATIISQVSDLIAGLDHQETTSFVGLLINETAKPWSNGRSTPEESQKKSAALVLLGHTPLEKVEGENLYELYKKSLEDACRQFTPAGNFSSHQPSFLVRAGIVIAPYLDGLDRDFCALTIGKILDKNISRRTTHRKDKESARDQRDRLITAIRFGQSTVITLPYKSIDASVVWEEPQTEIKEPSGVEVDPLQESEEMIGVIPPQEAYTPIRPERRLYSETQATEAGRSPLRRLDSLLKVEPELVDHMLRQTHTLARSAFGWKRAEGKSWRFSEGDIIFNWVPNYFYYLANDNGQQTLLEVFDPPFSDWLTGTHTYTPEYLCITEYKIGPRAIERQRAESGLLDLANYPDSVIGASLFGRHGNHESIPEGFEETMETEALAIADFGRENYPIHLTRQGEYKLGTPDSSFGWSLSFGQSSSVSGAFGEQVLSTAIEHNPIPYKSFPDLPKMSLFYALLSRSDGVDIFEAARRRVELLKKASLIGSRDPVNDSRLIALR